MSKPQKVVWTKGMFLMPQHFQAQDEYFEHELHFRAAVSNFANWGFSRLGIDEASLVNGFFTLRHCEGVFPDGLAFQASLVEELPAGRQVDEFFAASRQAYLDAYLCHTAGMRPAAHRVHDGLGRELCQSPSALAAEAQTITDATLGSDEKTIQVGKKSLRLPVRRRESGWIHHPPHRARITRSPGRNLRAQPPTSSLPSSTSLRATIS